MDYLMIVATDITNPTWVQEYMAYAPFKAKRQGGSSSQFLLVPIENGTTH
jgi:hypothetical protein